MNMCIETGAVSHTTTDLIVAVSYTNARGILFSNAFDLQNRGPPTGCWIGSKFLSYLIWCSSRLKIIFFIHNFAKFCLIQEKTIAKSELHVIWWCRVQNSMWFFLYFRHRFRSLFWPAPHKSIMTIIDRIHSRFIAPREL